MPGINGKQTASAWARSSTWNVPASVLQQLLLTNTTGFDDQPELVEDDAFTQQYLAEGEIGDRKPLTPTIGMMLRYEQGPDTFMAASMGSAATPVVVSSQAANSLVAYSHVITMADDLTHMFTLATDMVNYVQELRTFKVSGFTIKTAAQGKMTIDFPIVADRATYDSTVNINSTVRSATISTPGNRAFRKFGVLRMNLQSAGSLGSNDIMTLARDVTIEHKRPLAQDLVLGQDTIIEPDDDGWWEGTMEITFARMNTVTANSMAFALSAGNVFKGDLTFTGTYINSTTQRSIKFEWPDLQIMSQFKAELSGHTQVRPNVKFKMYKAAANPTGMAFTSPMRITIINARSTNLLA